jgi:prevent-host-death family protein
MTIHVNIGEAKTRLSELVAKALRGEDVVLDKAGNPQVKLVPVGSARELAREEIAARRRAAFGMYNKAFSGLDLSIEAIKAERGDPDDNFRRKFGPDR